MWEQPARPARTDAIPVGARVFHQKFGYGTVNAVDDDKLDIAVRNVRQQARARPVRGTSVSGRHAIALETVSVSVTEDAMEAYEAALATACLTVGFFRDDDTGIWRVEGVKQVGVNEPELLPALWPLPAS